MVHTALKFMQTVMSHVKVTMGHAHCENLGPGRCFSSCGVRGLHTNESSACSPHDGETEAKRLGTGSHKSPPTHQVSGTLQDAIVVPCSDAKFALGHTKALCRRCCITSATDSRQHSTTQPPARKHLQACRCFGVFAAQDGNDDQAEKPRVPVLALGKGQHAVCSQHRGLCVKGADKLASTHVAHTGCEA